MARRNTSSKADGGFTANISDNDCMKDDYWIDYSTEEKNQQFIHDLQTAKTQSPEAVLQFVNSAMSGWVVDMCDTYDDDLSKLQKNWNDICDRFRVPTQKILLVKYIVFNEDRKKTRHNNLMSVCDVLTAVGFIVKDVHHFMKCNGCSRLMLSENAQKQLWMTNNVFKVCRSCTSAK